jgi:thiol-disulfide isomerase/thioredoxin
MDQELARLIAQRNAGLLDDATFADRVRDLQRRTPTASAGPNWVGFAATFGIVVAAAAICWFGAALLRDPPTTLAAPATPAPTAPAAPPTVGARPEAVDNADQLLADARAAHAAGDVTLTKDKIADLTTRFPEAATRASGLMAELAVVGTEAGELTVSRWFTPQSTTFSEGKATLVVFWEAWCPHCVREMPKLEANYSVWRSRGLNVVALTRVTKSSTDDKVLSFIAEHHLSYPVGKDDGTLSERFGIRGIPAAVVVRQGEVVWRGHPSVFDDAAVSRWVAD